MKKNRKKKQGENPWTLLLIMGILFVHGFEKVYLVYEGGSSWIFPVLKYVLLFIFFVKIILWADKVGLEKEEKE